MKLIKILIISLFILAVFYPSSAYAQQCGGGVTCCSPISGDDPDCQYQGTIPGTCDDNCNATCPNGGSETDNNCGWSNATPPPGGGGDPCAYSPVNCQYGKNDSSYSDQQTERRNICPTGNAQSWYQSCYDAGVDGTICVDIMRTYACCPFNAPSQCVDSYQTYSVTVPPDASAYNCSPDAWVSTVSTGQVYGTHKECDEGSCQWFTDYYLLKTCQKTITTCSCVPICTITNPSTPALLSPANGTTVTTPTISLVWSNLTQTWGDSCTTNNNQFEIYIGTSPSSLGLLGTVGSGSGSASFSGTAGNTYYWKVRAKNGSTYTDSAVWSFTIVDADPWWQAKDGDVTTNNDLHSLVPNTKLFNIVGLGGYPGLPVYGGTFNLSNTPTKISATSWNVNTTTTLSRIFDYTYFENLIPDQIKTNFVEATENSLKNSNGYLFDGFEWYKAVGDLIITSDIDLGNRKVVIFVEDGDMSIGGRLNLTDGQGFLGVFVDGNIVIDPAVTGSPSIEGLYLAQSGFSTGLSTNQLHVRGSIASYGGISLDRDLSNNSNPAELFEFAPDQLLLFPEKLGYRRIKWAEIAP